MPAPPTANLRVVKYAPGWGYAAVEWERALAAIDWTRPHAEGGPERLKLKTLPDGTKDTTVWRARLNLGGREHDVVLKVEPLATLRKKAQALLRRTKAFRQWKGAEVLAGAGFRAAQGMAMLRGPGVEVLVIESLPGRSALEVLASPDTNVRAEIDAANELGRWTRDVWDAGIHNRDHKPSNVLVLQSSPVLLALVDTVGVSRKTGFERRFDTDRVFDLEHMLAKLYIEPKGCGLLVRRSLWMRVFLSAWDGEQPKSGLTGTARRQAIKDKLDDVLGHVEWHGDPAPKDDPLARG